jgi:hypothetical protein
MNLLRWVAGRKRDDNDVETQRKNTPTKETEWRWANVYIYRPYSLATSTSLATDGVDLRVAD